MLENTAWLKTNP